MDDPSVTNIVVPKGKVILDPFGRGKIGDGRHHWNDLQFQPGIAGPPGPTGPRAVSPPGIITNIPTTTTHAKDLTITPKNTGGWSEYRVSGIDATTTGQVLVDITGLASGTLNNAALYEFETLILFSTSADAAGVELGIHAGGTGTAATVNALLFATSTAVAALTATINAIDTATAALLTAASITGSALIRGFVTTRSTGTATISIRHLKVTSGTSTIKIGSVLRIRKV